MKLTTNGALIKVKNLAVGKSYYNSPKLTKQQLDVSQLNLPF